MFDHLMDEVACINRAYGYRGVFDAIVYIQTNLNEYEGTKVYSEFRKFMNMGQEMFKPVEEV
jgi:hypothetical protein